MMAFTQIMAIWTPVLGDPCRATLDFNCAAQFSDVEIAPGLPQTIETHFLFMLVHCIKSYRL